MKLVTSLSKNRTTVFNTALKPIKWNSILLLFINSSCISINEKVEIETGDESVEETKTNNQNMEENNNDNMKLGAFSLSLSVKDLSVSKQFYEKLGFTVLGGSMEQNYLIMKNENSLIGLFQGMFEGNLLTFNPGWEENGKDIEQFNDIREIQTHLTSNGIDTGAEIDKKSTGPASMMITDPDGNVILIDQHR